MNQLKFVQLKEKKEIQIVDLEKQIEILPVLKRKIPP